MANELAKPQSQFPANAAQVSTRHLVREFLGDLSDKIDLTPFERTVKGLVPPQLLKKRYAWDNYCMCVANAQREALKKAGKTGSIEEMVGDEADRTHFRELLVTIITAAVDAKQDYVPFRILVPDGDPSLKVFDGYLNGGQAILVKQGAVSLAKPIKFESKGVGLGKFSVGGHDPELLAAAKARVEKSIAAPKA